MAVGTHMHCVSQCQHDSYREDRPWGSAPRIICCARLTPDVPCCKEQGGAGKGGLRGWNAMTAINWAKLSTIAAIALCVLQHGGIGNMRQV
jgi:hypothetical protein